MGEIQGQALPGLCISPSKQQEGFNETRKMMLKTFVDQHSHDWDKCLPYLLFTYREVAQESTGFSSFESLFGRRVQGFFDLMGAEWEGKASSDGGLVVEYVLTFRERLSEVMSRRTQLKPRRDGCMPNRVCQIVRNGGQSYGVHCGVVDELQTARTGHFKIIK